MKYRKNINGIEQGIDIIRSAYAGDFPAIAVVLGSGLSQFGEVIEDTVEIPYIDIPAFPITTVPGHDGRLVIGSINKTPVVCMLGRRHVYEGHCETSIAAPIRILRRLGVRILIITNSAGSLQNDMLPGSLMLIEDHINFSFSNPLIGPNDDNFGPRFVDLTNAWDRDLRQQMCQAAASAGIELKKGIYVHYCGPNFETPAEIRMFRDLGGSAVGMSTVPECLIANHCGMKCVGISVITNLGAGLGDQVSHKQNRSIANQACPVLQNIIGRFVSNYKPSELLEQI